MSNFITVEDSQTTIKITNLMRVANFLWFVWLVFHFIIVFFFWLVLESTMLVGLFLWVWNIVALVLDIPIWVLQKYIKPKTFLFIASSAMLVVSWIFMYFVYFQEIVISTLTTESQDWIVDSTINLLWSFLWNWINVILLLIAGALYGFIKESYDVTTLSYIFNNSSPSEYATLISRYNINFWIWSMTWLISAWIILAFSVQLVIAILITIVICFMIFLFKYFDNSSYTVDFWDIKELRKIKLDTLKESLKTKRNEISKNISTTTFKEMASSTKLLFLKPVEVKKSIDFDEFFNSSKENFFRFKKILLDKPYNLILLWTLLVVLHYWFWDTFVSTFQVEFLNKVLTTDFNQETFLIKQSFWIISWYILLWLIVIPAFLLQDFFIGLSQKFWVLKVVMFWTMLSSFSLFFFWFTENIYLVILFWLTNSVWYAATMPIAQSVFCERYNVSYAKKFNLKEIDSTISRAPLKIVLNFANVLWLIIWWTIVRILWFNGFFIFFGLVLLGLLIFSFFNWDKFEIKEEKDDNKNIPVVEEKKVDVDFV